MAKDYPLHFGDQLPEFWVQQVQEYISALAPRLRLTQLSSTALRVAGSASNQQGIAIGGLWRYITSNQDATHPGGAAGIYDVVVVTSDNVIVSTPAPFTDDTDYNFYLKILPAGVAPAGNTPLGNPIVAYQKVGEVDWDASKIVGVRQLVGATDVTISAQPTAPNPNAWALQVVAAPSHDAAAPIMLVRSASSTTYFAVYPTGVTVSGTLAVGGAFSVGSTLHAVGAAQFDSAVSMGDTLTVSGSTVLGAASGSTVHPYSDGTTKLATDEFVQGAIALALSTLTFTKIWDYEHEWAVLGAIAVGNLLPFLVTQRSGGAVTKKLVGFYAFLNSGTATVKIRRATNHNLASYTDMPAFSGAASGGNPGALAITSTPTAYIAAAPVLLADKDILLPVVTAVASPVDLMLMGIFQITT